MTTPKSRRLGPAYWAASAICLISAGLCLYWRATEGHTLRGFIALAVTGLAAIAIHQIASHRKES